MSRSEKLTQFVIVVCIAAILTAIGNVMDGKHVFSESLLGVAVLAGIATIGAVISSLPYANKFPMVFWVSLVGVIISLPGMPGQPWVIEKTSHITFLATTTPVLAYAGLSLGKDLGAFRRLSWRIIPVALAVTAGTLICATVLAQIMLHLEGLI
ncbi:hypothetical protein [Veillonella tobetsuensis]|uniref:DUF340 domain-containing protein n=1 Tax=Veillonella tobetsuensis TaxID=1110546 RepID=A0A480B3T5_9FIRM|nr:hypothetical protein [Veillonella tobetsuensis]GCL68184.1 hypothetical protein PAGU1578_18050 [Veillonella tobetsuensis]